MIKTVKIKWLKKPQAHDYPAAASYLSLIYNKKKVKAIIARLKSAPVGTHKAKDILRASGLSPLDMNNHHVKMNTEKIHEGELLSPILLVRDEENGRVVIADGYHRLCTVYLMNEDITVPDKIV